MCPANAAPAEATTTKPNKMSHPTSGAPNSTTPAASVNTTRTTSPTGNLANELRSHLTNDPDKQELPAGLANLSSRPNYERSYPSFPSIVPRTYAASQGARPNEPPPEESGPHDTQADPPPPPEDCPASTAVTVHIPNEQLLADERYIFQLRITGTLLTTPHSYNPAEVLPNLNAALSVAMGDKIGSEDGLPPHAFSIMWIPPPRVGTPNHTYIRKSVIQVG